MRGRDGVCGESGVFAVMRKFVAAVKVWGKDDGW